MKLIMPRDSKKRTWIFHKEEKRNLVLYSRYEHYRCKNCGKIDEDTALASGIESNITFDFADDYVLTDDGMLCMSDRLCEIMEQHAPGDLKFVAFPHGSTHKIVRPSRPGEIPLSPNQRILGPGNIERGSLPGYPLIMDSEERCIVCNRYFQVMGFPTLQEVSDNADPNSSVVASPMPERWRGISTWLFGRETLCNVLKAKKIRGCEFIDNW